MASFCIEAFLIIAFLTAYNVAHLSLNRELSSRTKKILDAFGAVLPTFYWSSVLLSLGIIVASLKVSSEATAGGSADQLKKWRKGESSYSPYDRQLVALASFLSALPPFMAWIMLRQSSRRRRLLNTLILPFIGIPVIPLVIMSAISDPEWLFDNAAGQVVDLWLYDMEAMKISSYTAIASLSLSVLIGLIVFLSHRKKTRSAKVSSRHSTCKMIFTGLVQVVLLAIMIGALIVFFFFRTKIIDAGDTSQLEWSFGQVLALTTWIPVVVDFVYSLRGQFHTPTPCPGLILLCHRD